MVTEERVDATLERWYLSPDNTICGIVYGDILGRFKDGAVAETNEVKHVADGIAVTATDHRYKLGVPYYE